MGDTLYDGRRVRLLTILDEGDREGLAIVSLAGRSRPLATVWAIGKWHFAATPECVKIVSARA